MEHTLLPKKDTSPTNREEYREARTKGQGTAALVSQLKQCGDRKDLQGGRVLHSNAVETGCHKNRYVASALIKMYSKCGSVKDARDVFEKMAQHDVVTWTALILGYVENGESLMALDVFNNMDCVPDRVTLIAALKACAALASNSKMDKKESCLQKGISIHMQARERGFEKEISIANTLIDMYSKCGSMLHARKVFDTIVQKSVVSWTALILGYVENGESLVGLELFNRMDCAPNRLTFVAALKACTRLSSDKRMCLKKGVAVHKQARACGVEGDIFVANTLMDMYSKCGKMEYVREVFNRMTHRDVVSWNVFILGYVENGEILMALDVFDRMECVPNRLTFVAAMRACACLATENKLDKETYLQKGISIHKQARERGFEKDVFVGSTLVDMYSKCGSMLYAKDVFDRLVHRDVVSWTALILGYLENGESSVALEVFNTMDCVPDSVTFVAALKACASLGALETGQRIHIQVRDLSLEQDLIVANSLVDFYGKCGNVTTAEEVFNHMHSRDIVSWTALIGGYSLLGNIYKVFSLVKRMEEAGLRMDGVTIQLILTTCSHAGMVEEGQEYFDSMSKYGITPSLGHYTCMVDMLGRANKLQEALSLIRSMPFKANSPVWMSLLWSCKKWSNIEIGKVAFRVLVSQNDKEHVAAAYVLIKNIYEKLGMEEEREYTEGERREVSAPKKGGRTRWFDGDGRSFLVGDNIEEEVAEIVQVLVC